MKVKIKRVRGGSMGDQRNYGLVTGSIWNYENKASTNNVGTTLSPVPRDEATIEAERGETVVGDLDNDGMVEHAKIGGKRHSHGGTPLNVPDGSFVFSDFSKLRIKNKDLLKGIFNMSASKGVTPAKVAQRYELNKYKQILNDPESDAMSKKTAQLMIDNNMKKLGQLALIQEGMKGFPDGIPAIAMPLLQSAPQGTQKMQKGGIVKYRNGGLTRYQGTDVSEVSENGGVPMRSLPPSQNPNTFTPNPNDLNYIGEDPYYGPLFESTSGDRWAMDPDGNWTKVLQEVEVNAPRTNPPSEFQMDFDGDGQVTMSDYEAYEQYKNQMLQRRNQMTLSDQFQDPARNIFGVDNERSDAYNLALGFSPVGLMQLASDVNNNFVRPAIYGEEEQPYESVLTDEYLNQKLAQNQATSYSNADTPFSLTAGNPRMLSAPMLNATSFSPGWWKGPAIGAGLIMAGGLPKDWNPYYKVGYEYPSRFYNWAKNDPVIGEWIDDAAKIAKGTLTTVTYPFRKRTWGEELQPLGMTKQRLWDRIRRKPFTPGQMLGPEARFMQSPASRYLGNKWPYLAAAGAVGGFLYNKFGEDIYNWATGTYNQVDQTNSASPINTDYQITPTVTDEGAPYDMTELTVTNPYQDSIAKVSGKDTTKASSTTKNQDNTTNNSNTSNTNSTAQSDTIKVDNQLMRLGYSKAKLDTMPWESKTLIYNRGRKASDQIKKLGGENKLTEYATQGQVNDPDRFKFPDQNAVNAALKKKKKIVYPSYSTAQNYSASAGTQMNDAESGITYTTSPGGLWVGGDLDPADMDTKVFEWYKNHPAFVSQWQNYPGGFDGWVADSKKLGDYRRNSSTWEEAYDKWEKNEKRTDPDEWLADTYDNTYYKPVTGQYWYERDDKGKVTKKGKIKGINVQALAAFEDMPEEEKKEKKNKDKDKTELNSSNPQFQSPRVYGLGQPYPSDVDAYLTALNQRIPKFALTDYDVYPSLVTPLYKDPNLEMLNQVTQNVEGQGTGPMARNSATGIGGKAFDAASKLIAQNRALNDDIYMKTAAYNANAINEANKASAERDQDYIDNYNAFIEANARNLNKKDAEIVKAKSRMYKGMLQQAANSVMNPDVIQTPYGFMVNGTANNLSFSPSSGGSTYSSVWDSAFARFKKMPGVDAKEAAKMATEFARGAISKSGRGTAGTMYSPYDLSDE
jgi:hypothetical protein